MLLDRKFDLKSDLSAAGALDELERVSSYWKFKKLDNGQFIGKKDLFWSSRGRGRILKGSIESTSDGSVVHARFTFGGWWVIYFLIWEVMVLLFLVAAVLMQSRIETVQIVLPVWGPFLVWLDYIFARGTENEFIQSAKSNFGND